MFGASLLTLLLAAAPAPVALLAGGDSTEDATAALAPLPRLAEALRAAGSEVSTGPGLWLQLARAPVGELREVGSALPAGAQHFLDAAGQAFEVGDFAKAVRFAEDAVARLDAAPRSPAVEAGERAGQALWGLALAAVGEKASAQPHLLWSVLRDPAFEVDRSRVAPPRRRPLEEARRIAAGLPRGSLAVTGSAGASVYLDGRPCGRLPVTLTGLVDHRAWVWLEGASGRSLAHHVELGGAATSLAIDLDLEAGLAIGPAGEPIVRVGPEGQELRRLDRLQGALGSPVAVLSRSPGAGSWRLTGVSAGRSFALAPPPSAGGESGIFDELAHELSAELHGGPPAAGEGQAPVATIPAAQPPAPPVPPPAHGARAWPWVVATVAVVAVGTGVALYFALQTPGDVAVRFSAGSP